MGKVTEIREVNIENLKPYERNAKQHSADQVQKLCASIREFGFISPCLIDSEYNVIAGHGRIMAARDLGMESVPCLFIEGLTDEQRRAYILADNRLTELGEWDMDMVAEELQALSEEGFDIDLTGFTSDDGVIDTADIDDMGIGSQIDAMLAEKEPITKYGDVWQLGNHRLMCGDSTSVTDVEKLLGGCRLI